APVFTEMPLNLATVTPTEAEASAVKEAEAESDPIEKIEKLNRLREKGIITQAEFEMQKQRLLREV
ncbi:MAG TPA: SHOCT domain-containing protein, partial [Burkholderiaceae bacterium]|nr:SHOCT domain-containing protein [Burkholderiaceae bacterium]